MIHKMADKDENRINLKKIKSYFPYEDDKIVVTGIAKLTYNSTEERNEDLAILDNKCKS